MQGMIATNTLAISRVEKLWGRKTRQSEMLNQIIRFLRRQRQHLVASRAREHPMSLMLISWGQSREDGAREYIFGQ
jgi:hypothetical protein